MKLKALFVLLTVLIISVMWYNSPQREYENRPSVEIVLAKKSNIHDSVLARGYVEEAKKKTVRLNRTAKIEEIHFSVGDKVEKGDTILEVSEAESSADGIQSVFNFLPEVKDISDIESFYMPHSVSTVTEIEPQICAPISGVVTSLDISEGDVVLGQVPIITISDFNELCVRASVSELYIEDIEVGQRAELTGEAFSNHKYVATVTEISPIAKQKNSLVDSGETTVDVLLSIKTENTVLRPGYSVNAKIFTDSHNNATVLPYNCIFQVNDKEFVFVESGGIIYKRAIRTGFELDDVVEICSGVDAGERVVLNPSEDLKHEMSVKVGETT